MLDDSDVHAAQKIADDRLVLAAARLKYVEHDVLRLDLPLSRHRDSMTRLIRNPTAALAAALLGAAAAVLPAEVLAFGGLGHRTAGLLAEQELCPAARSEVADLGDGKSLGELGLGARHDPR